MACYGSETSQLLQALLLNNATGKKRKLDFSSGPASAERKKICRQGAREDVAPKQVFTLNETIVIEDESPIKSPAKCTQATGIDPLYLPEEETSTSDCTPIIQPISTLPPSVVDEQLCLLCSRSPSFDIQDAFLNLQTKKENTLKDVCWASKYAPKSAKEFLGGYSAVECLREWLQEWKLFIDRNVETEKPKKRSRSEKKASKSARQSKKNTRLDEESTDDDGELDGFDSDCSYEQTAPEEMPRRGYWVFSETGSGKTALAHALAEELGFSVLEINPSDVKDGRQALLECHEATQSHRIVDTVKRGGIADFFKPVTTKPGISRTKPHTMILIDDVDVVLDNEDSFFNGLEHLLKTTKRPVIFTSSCSLKPGVFDLETDVCDLPLESAPDVDVTCYACLIALAEDVVVNFDDVKKLVHECGSDFRKILNNLELWRGDLSLRDLPSVGASEERSVIFQNFMDASLLLPHRKQLPPILQNDPGRTPVILFSVTELMNEILTFIDADEMSDIHNAILSTRIRGSSGSDSGYNSNECSQLDKPSSSAPELMSSVSVGKDSATSDSAIMKKMSTVLDCRSHFSPLIKDDFAATFDIISIHPKPGVLDTDIEPPLAVYDVAMFEENCQLETEITAFFDSVFASCVPENVQDGPASSFPNSSVLRHRSDVGQRLLAHYERFNPTATSRRGTFVKDHWSYFRSMAVAEKSRQVAGEKSRGRRLRSSHSSHLTSDKVMLSHELANELAYDLNSSL